MGASEEQRSGFKLKSFLPILEWLPAYQKGWFRGDVIAALTLWALLVPEAMAYAGIAGMPPETGLYAAPLALVAYAIFGSSPHLDVGPSSAVAALSFSVVVGILGAIVIHAVWHNISFSKISQYRSITTLDYATAVVAMFGVLALGLLAGLVLAALLGLIVLLFGTKHRNTSVLGKVPETTIYRGIDHYPEADTYPGLLIIRFDGALFFANAHDFVTAVRQAIAAADPPPRVVIIDGESMNDVDATAIITLKVFQDQLLKTDIQLRFARVKSHVMDVMERGRLDEAIPAEHYYPTVQSAVDAFLAEQ
jgi:MFS superfamily sulfate permease-like transporter